MNGSKVGPKVSANDSDQHATISVPLASGKTTIHLRVADNFAIGFPYTPPADGAVSTGLKFVSRQWNALHDQLVLQLAGIGGRTYTLPMFNAPSGMAVQGANITKNASGVALQVAFPAGATDSYALLTVTLQFPAH